jgi:electron transfer flavoprotein alpha subunit
MLAVVVVRDGELPAGADETIAECGGRALLVDSSGFSPRAIAGAVAAAADDPVLVLPASADGRDLAPRLAHLLQRPLFAGAIAVTSSGAWLARGGGLAIEEVTCTEPFVATLVPGVRGVEPGSAPSDVRRVAAPARDARDVTVLATLPPDVTTMDLTEASRILGGGAGLDAPERFTLAAGVATAIGASLGATRVITDRGWLPHSRQIGTTGVVVDPRLYVALGISGAVQHTSGLGQPEHIVSVNTDPHCPMMQLADLAIVSDANEVLVELAARLGVARD